MEDNAYRNPMAIPEWRAQYEYHLALDCILPHLTRWGIKVKGMRVLDLGCGTGGLALAFAEKGAVCLGIDRDASQIAQALQMAAEHGVQAEFFAADVLKLEHLERLLKQRLFELIILSEFVEHLVTRTNVSLVLSRLRNHLAPGGYLYISFPPWFNPFGGHQAGWPVIRCIPWFHLVPHSLKRIIAPRYVRQYLEFFQELNHLTISAFEKIIRETQLTIVQRELFHLRPEFYWRYGVPTIHSSLFAKIPFLREVTTTGAFYLLAKT